ncbi:glycosyl transferase family 2 [Pandoraea sp. NE5]|uniref:glycosyltransferase family 2 protein n=1 Tax=Pandoraea sp. NE5 TaxID=2904129 RepID=UPI002201DC6B|nr:glycosyl transferase family 2 [Pandoraea sp. NE5]
MIEASSPATSLECSPRLPLTVTILTRNERHNIADCITSVQSLASQIVVLDNASTDGTTDIARAAGAEVHVTDDWPGFGPQKNRALSLATQPWVLSLDADERVTPELAAEIAAAIASSDRGGYAGFRMPRLSQFLGHWVRHCGWYPDYVLRLFRREAGRFSDNLVHERVIVDGEIGTLAHHLLHYSYTEVRQVEDKVQRYARAGATEMALRGKRVSPLKPWINGGWAFVRTYLLRRGFLDGATGAAIARMNARSAFLKYALLRRADA